MTKEFSPFLIECPLHSLSSTVNCDWNEDEASALCKSRALAEELGFFGQVLALPFTASINLGSFFGPQLLHL